jgi:ABC-2 type transport system ATP-binding protein
MTPAELSKGMRHKVQFIVAVLHDPEVLILDEPFSGLDPISVCLLKEVILGLKQSGRTIIFSTHQMEQVELICDEVCLLNRGTKILAGALYDIKQSFKPNAALLGYSGTNSFLGDEPYQQINQHPGHNEILLKDLINAQELLRRALSAGVVINRFQIIEPTLNDIFIETVQERNGKGKSDNHL